MGDPALGTNQTVCVDLEDTWGSDPASPDAKQISVVSCGLVPSQALIENPSIRGDFSANDPALGRRAGDGPMPLIPNVTVLPFFTKVMAGSGAFATTGVGDPYTHTGTLGKAKQLSMVVDRKVDINGTDRFYKANGVRFARVSIPIADTGFLQIGAELASKRVSLGLSAYDASPADWRSGTPLEQLQLASADILIGGSPVAYVAGGNIDIDFGLFLDDYRAGSSGDRVSLVQGITRITGSLKLAVDSVSVLTLIDTTTPTSLSTKWTAAANRSFQTSLPRIFLSKTGAPLNDPGPVFVDVTFQAAYDSGIGGMGQLITVNDQASY